MNLPQNLKGIVDLERYIPCLKAWFRREWQAIHGQSSAPGRGLLMGCPLWGEEYIDRFFHFSLPTIRAPKNIAALREHGCRLVIYTDDAGFDRFWVMKRALRKEGIDVEIKVIPQEIMDQVPDMPLNKYWLLGTVQQLLIQEAAECNMAFHALHPDHLHNEEYYPSMFKLVAAGNDCIAQTSISGDLEACLPELEQWREADKNSPHFGSLSIPALEVGDMGWRHLHEQTRYNLMNDVDMTKGFPRTHFQCWQGEDKLYLYCCHMNAAYLSPAVCREAPVRLHNALDTELPFYMTPGGTVCVPEASDGMTFIELSDSAKFGGGDLVPFGEFAAQCWSTVHYRDDWMPFFMVANEVPIKPQAKFMAVEEIQKRQNSIVHALVNIKPALQKRAEELAAEAVEAGAKAKADEKRQRKNAKRAEMAQAAD